MTSWEGSAPVGPVTEGDMGDIWSPEGGNLPICEGYHSIIAYKRLYITWKVIYTEILSPRYPKLHPKLTPDDPKITSVFINFDRYFAISQILGRAILSYQYHLQDQNIISDIISQSDMI